MGFGHRVYKHYDPRAKIIKESCDSILASLGIKDDPLLDIAKSLEEAALKDDYFLERKLYPTSISTAASSCAPSASREMFTVMFAIGRMPGWIANFKEILDEPHKRIYRPRQVYVGPAAGHYVPIDKRR